MPPTLTCPVCKNRFPKPDFGTPECSQCGFSGKVRQATSFDDILDAPEAPTHPTTPIQDYPTQSPLHHPSMTYAQPAWSGPKTSGMAIAGLVCAILAWLLGWIPFFGWVTGPILWLLGLIFSAVALSSIKKSDGQVSGKGMAIAGLILSLIGVVIGIMIVLASVVFVLVSDLGEGGDEAPQIAFKKESGGNLATFTVTKIVDGPVYWGDLEATCGQELVNHHWDYREVTAGDTLTCRMGESFTVMHEPTDELIYGPVMA